MSKATLKGVGLRGFGALGEGLGLSSSSAGVMAEDWRDRVRGRAGEDASSALMVALLVDAGAEERDRFAGVNGKVRAAGAAGSYSVTREENSLRRGRLAIDDRLRWSWARKAIAEGGGG